jgi:hypothetical protein
MKVIITHYNRPEFLKQQLKELIGYDVTVIDDGSECDLSFVDDLITFPHLGKKGFWVIWKKALQIAKYSLEDVIMFAPDDFLNFDLKAIEKLDLNNKVYNIINDGRKSCWGEKQYVDCGFIASKESIMKINVNKPLETWFNTPDKSSSVGYQLTKEFKSLGIEMITPIKSLAFHGNHQSKMHPEHRKHNPLISR